MVQGSSSVFVSPRPRAPPSCVTTGAGEGEAPSGTAEMPEGLPAPPGKQGPVPVRMGLVSSLEGDRCALQDGWLLIPGMAGSVPHQGLDTCRGSLIMTHVRVRVNLGDPMLLSAVVNTG